MFLFACKNAQCELVWCEYLLLELVGVSIIHYTAVIDDAICDVKDEFFHVLSLLFFFAFQRLSEG